MNERLENDSGDDLQAPEKLVAAFSALPRRHLKVPPQIDAAILHAARRHMRSPQSMGLPSYVRAFKSSVVHAWRRMCETLLPQASPIQRLAVYACLVALIAWVGSSVVGRHLSGRTEFASADLNRDGQVDILDAFALARDLNAGRAAANADQNADGRVDRRDVEAIAAQAVQLQSTRHL